MKTLQKHYTDFIHTYTAILAGERQATFEIGGADDDG